MWFSGYSTDVVKKSDDRTASTDEDGRLSDLKAILGDPLPASERAMWAALTTVQRAKAMQRMKVLQRWSKGEGGMDAKRAAADAGVSVTRFYEMGKAWRDRRSLSSLGTFASAPKTRVGRHDVVIRRKIGSVFDAHPKASVRQLALALEVAIGGDLPDAPSHNTLRRYVELERLRREREETAGNEVRMDCSACILTPSDDVLLTAFVIMDRATQVILGAALGHVGASRAGYARAAQDALRRLSDGQFSKIRWVDRVARVQIVMGSDLLAWSEARPALEARGIGAGLELSSRDDRFGRYLRQATSLRVGTVVFMPKHTAEAVEGASLARSAEPTPDQQVRLSVEVDDYNAAILAAIDHGSNAPPPDGLMRLLQALGDS